MSYPDNYTKAQAAISAAFPHDDHFHRNARLAFLSIFHAATWVEMDLQVLAAWIQTSLEDAPWSTLEYGPTNDPLTLADNLEHLARQLRKAYVALDAARPHWVRYFDSQEGESDAIPTTSNLLSVRRLRAEPELIGEEPPF